MLGLFKRHKIVAQASVLVGSISAAAFVFGASLTSAGAASSAQHLTQMQVGARLPTVARLNAAPAVLRTREQMDRYQAEHPSLGLTHAGGRPLIPMGMKAYRLAKQLAMQAARGEKPGVSSVHPATASHRALAAAGPSESDTGSVGIYPPDASVAIGSGSQIAVVVNSTFNVYNRQGVALLNETLAAFLGSANIVEPRVLYDPIWNRWVFLAVDAPNGGAPAFWLAASTTSNAAGSYAMYHVTIPFAAGDVWDYPMVGMTQDALLFTGNHFTSNGTTYNGSVLFGAPKSRVYNSLGWGAGLAGVPTGSGTIAPPVVLDSSDRAYFVGVNTGSSTLDVYVGNAFGTAEWNFTGSASIAASGQAVPPDAQQYNATQVLDTLDARFEGPSTQYYDTGGHIVVWNANTIGSGSFPIPHFYEIDATASTLLESVAFFDSPTSYDFNSSIAVNPNNEVILNWSSTDPANHRNARTLFSGWQPGDSTSLIGTGGVLTSGGPALRGNPANSSLQRWGAYSAVALDPSAPAACSFAPNRRAVVVNERTIDYKTWGTEFGIVGFC